MEGIPKVIKFNEGGKLFLRAFLLDATKNENDWKVVSASIPHNIRSFVGMPLVLDQGYNHPKWVDGGLQANVIHQQRFAIGTITDVVQKEGRWDAIIEITDPLARDAIEKNEIPFYVSPRIVHDPKDSDLAINDWLGLHLAIVDKPAYGDKAKIEGACFGMSEQCQIALKSAKKEECGFCVKTALLKLVNNSSHLDSSLSPPAPKKQPMENSPQAIDTSKFVSVEDYNALKSQVDAFKVAAEEAKASYLKELEGIKEARRVEKISAIVGAKIADAKKAEETIKKFVDAKASPELVADAMSLIPEQRRDNSEQFTAKADAKAQRKVGYSQYRSYVQSVIKGADV